MDKRGMKLIRIVLPVVLALLPAVTVVVPSSLLAEEAEEKKAAAAEPAEGEWVQLFNGKNLDGWTPKIRHQAFGEDKQKTFRVEDGLLKVRYDKGYKEFGETFGHLFYKGSHSYYRLRVEYRFVGEQLKGGPGWAWRNSGVMLHGQDPATMGKDQDFPNSIEGQLLGGKAEGKRTTMNLCTPGTHVVRDEKLFKPHCVNSSSKTYRGDQWVTVEFEVHGDESIQHKIGDDIVLDYQKPQLDDGTLLKEGSISVQSESHPIDFRKIEMMVLKP